MNLSEYSVSDVWPDPIDQPTPREFEAIRKRAERLREADLVGYERLPSWLRRFQIALEQLHAERKQTKTVEGQRIARLERTVAAQQEQIAALKKAINVAKERAIDAMIDAVGSTLPQWAERERFIRHGDVWRDDVSYPPHTLCTHAGSGFISVRECAPGERPGTGPDGGWRLTVKRAGKEEPKP